MVNKKDDDFAKYEREYLQKMEKGSFSKRSKLIKEANVAKITPLDWAILEAVRRDDSFAFLKFGFMRMLESLLKLHCQKLILMRNNHEPTFDELEQAQIFLDSAMHKEYKSRMEKLSTQITDIMGKRIILIYDILGYKSSYSWHNLKMSIKGEDATEFCKNSPTLTEKGKIVLQDAHKQAREVYRNMSDLYYNSKNPVDFYDKNNSYADMLPLLLVMGFTGGAMMAALQASQTPTMMMMGGFAEYGGVGGDIGDVGGDFIGGGW